MLGVISAYDLGKFRVLGVQDAFPAREEKARAIGGNGVIIDSYQPVKSGIMSTGYSVYGRAVRIGR